MNPMPGLYAELAKARACVDGKAFAEAPEAFKDIESIKVRVAACERKQGRGQKQYSEDR
ncbi:hypothetical protein [Frateuria terrea]|uniref:Uncharacterized protein n=1 Tax=Frateuria terrea TaxID=529704 RepID=A0A1H6ZUD7_9GAMM|nr:hypothetical protein [Frateuria terrea]SEJ55794.1 hypothetical protein SAMN04487997_0211 [Frateuria terrea]SFP46951.1 hypothetical protein SAMN02927913_2178 [Frateuria terrea]